MATSEVEICNSALYKIGSKRIGALTDDSKAAIICNDQYERCRKEVLRAHPWNFAVSWVALAATTNTPVADHWDNEFLLPADVLRVLGTNLVDNSWEIGYNVDGNKVLWCRDDEVKIQYIKDVKNVTRFAPDFEEALAWRLAVDLAYAIVQSQTIQRNMFGYYSAALAQARSFDAQEHGDQQVQADEFTDVRY